MGNRPRAHGNVRPRQPCAGAGDCAWRRRGVGRALVRRLAPARQPLDTLLPMRHAGRQPTNRPGVRRCKSVPPCAYVRQPTDARLAVMDEHTSLPVLCRYQCG
ncbi:conserved protein of unknown function (plasmid) [Cupriavidus neocaledonicus]|uniref:Uncharacterized protein n=1 Tax=Cupriavidus neocaledonicus TaxID=1040979 RepID=A0A375HTM9_9BURK|nr:conserved protein of unknown function [Cupriavidus neocaledonicus]